MEIKELPYYVGVANSISDFFDPDDAREIIVVRRGRMKHAVHGVVEVLMAAFTPVGNFNLLVFSKLSNSTEWRTETSMCSSNEFKNTIIEKYNIKQAPFFIN